METKQRTEPEDVFVVDAPALHLLTEVSQEDEVGSHGSLWFVGVGVLSFVGGHLKWTHAFATKSTT